MLSIVGLVAMSTIDAAHNAQQWSFVAQEVPTCEQASRLMATRLFVNIQRIFGIQLDHSVR
jgi:hypothetical protein